jgi:hypothetical protein
LSIWFNCLLPVVVCLSLYVWSYIIRTWLMKSD